MFRDKFNKRNTKHKKETIYEQMIGIFVIIKHKIFLM